MKKTNKVCKKILIINYISVFPKIMASQDRVFNLAKRLSLDHDVTVVTSYKNDLQKNISELEFKKQNIKYVGVKAVNNDSNNFYKYIIGLKFLIYHYFFFHTNDYYYAGSNHFNKAVSKIIRNNKYDIVQIQYWFNWRILANKSIKKVLKVIDSQDILYDKREQQAGNNNKGVLFNKMLLKKYKKLEINAYRLADLILSITPYDQNVIMEINPNCKNIIIPTGQDYKYFNEYPNNPQKNTILFYGSMGSIENVNAFFRFYNKIYPIIKKEISDLKIILLGADPPQKISELNKSNEIIVTGFVKDVREYIAMAKLMILPLDVAAGFRSRTVETMAMGVPIVGSFKALLNVGIINGKHGFIKDSNVEMANYSIKILKDDSLHSKMSNACKKLVKIHYSIESTYGKLSQYYKNI